MDVRFINPVLQSVLNVLGTMANLQPQVGRPTLKQDEAAPGEVSGVMRMVGPQARASVAISFSKPLIIDIVRRMLGEDIQEIDDTARDLTGEIANMVVGGAKHLFTAQGYDFAMSTPQVLDGHGHAIHHEFSGRTILLPLSAEAGQLFVEICFENP